LEQKTDRMADYECEEEAQRSEQMERVLFINHDGRPGFAFFV
jgi:hypothetical protein